MQNIMKIKYGSGHMEIDLYELFYYNDKVDEPDADVIHYSKLQRVTKLFKFFYQVGYENEQSIELCLNWLNTEKEKWCTYQKTASENLAVQSVGSSRYRSYKKEVSSCNRFLKLFDTAIRILNEGR